MNENTDEVASGEERLSLIWTAVEYFRTVGYANIFARVVGMPSPEVIEGQAEPHRPDLTCRLSNRAHTILIVDVATQREVRDAKGSKKRWELFGSAAEHYKGEFHLWTPAWSKMLPDLHARAKRILDREGIDCKQIWRV